MEIHLFSLFLSSDDCEGAAGVENSSLHLKLEKRKGMVAGILSVFLFRISLLELLVFLSLPILP